MFLQLKVNLFYIMDRMLYIRGFLYLFQNYGIFPIVSLDKCAAGQKQSLLDHLD